MGRLLRLVASTALLSLGVRAQANFKYQGCVLPETESDAVSISVYPQGPTPCANRCAGMNYNYMAVSAQECICWTKPPTINRTYTNTNNADCTFNCDAPYNSLYCGGIDVSTLDFLYSYYAVPVLKAVSGSAPAPTSAGPRRSSVAGGGPQRSSPAPVAGTLGGGGSASRSGTAGIKSSASASLTLVSVPGKPGFSTLVPIRSSTRTSRRTSRTVHSTTTGSTLDAPLATAITIYTGQDYRIPVKRFLEKPTDKVISYRPQFEWLSFDAATQMFWGTIPIDYRPGVVIIHVTAGTTTKRAIYEFDIEFTIRVLGAEAAPSAAAPGAPRPAPLVPGAAPLPGVGGPPPGYSGGPVPPGPRPSGPPAPGSPGDLYPPPPPGYSGGPVPPGPRPPGPPPPGSPGDLYPPPGGPGGPYGAYGAGGELPCYTNTVYEDITSTYTRCPICEAETTIFARPVGTTLITAEVYTTSCEITTVRTDEHGESATDVYTTESYIPYNPAESTTVVTTEEDFTRTIAKTILVAVTKQVLKATGTGEASPEVEKTKNAAEVGPEVTGGAASGTKSPEEVAPENTPEAASTEAPGPEGEASETATPEGGDYESSPGTGGSESGASETSSPGGESDSGNSPFRVGPAASDHPSSSGSGSGTGTGSGNEGATTPDLGSGQTNSTFVTAGATRFGSDSLVETFVLLSGIAFGVILLL